MPNHCDNDLVVRGPTAEVKRFLAEIVDEDSASDCRNATIDCEKILPYPDIFKALDAMSKAWEKEALQREAAGERVDRKKSPKDGFNCGGEDWKSETWGSKWGAYNGSPLKFKEGKKVSEVQLRFDTAWSPLSEGLYQRLSKMFPTLKITNRYFEAGMSFKGELIAEGGEIVSHWDAAYKGRRGG